MSYTIIASGTNPAPVCNISMLTLDDQGRLVSRRDTDGVERAGFLAVAGETVAAAAREDAGDRKVPVIALLRRRDDGLAETARVRFEGENICHVSINGSLIGGACYTSGDVTVWGWDGERFTGERFHKNYNLPTRVSHPHCMYTGPDGRFYLVDLGLDRVTTFDCTADGVREAGTLHLHEDDGPRHILFHPVADTAYLITEYSNIVYALRRDASGTLTVCQRLSTLPEGYAEESYGASLALDPGTGKLYASNRGMNSVAVFDVQPSGLLRAAGYADCGGVWPRHIALTHDGRFLLVCNERSDKLCVLPIGEDGMPGSAVEEIAVVSASFAVDVT